MDSAFKIATRMAMLYEGKIIEQGPPDAFRNSKNSVVAQFVSGATEGPIQQASQMKIQRREIRTGLLVLFTIGLIVVVLISLGAPGVFSPQKEFSIYFDNASGVNAGAPILLAGRRIGQVIHVSSPVPKPQRPEGYPGVEALVPDQRFPGRENLPRRKGDHAATGPSRRTGD